MSFTFTSIPYQLFAFHGNIAYILRFVAISIVLCTVMPITIQVFVIKLKLYTHMYVNMNCRINEVRLAYFFYHILFDSLCWLITHEWRRLMLIFLFSAYMNIFRLLKASDQLMKCTDSCTKWLPHVRLPDAVHSYVLCWSKIRFSLTSYYIHFVSHSF